MLGEHQVFPILLSKDLDASRAFYHGVLGLDILREDPNDRIVFHSAEGRLAVTPKVGGQFWLRPPSWAPRAAVVALRDGKPVAAACSSRSTRRRTLSRPTALPTWATRGRPGSSTRAATALPSSSQRARGSELAWPRRQPSPLNRRPRLPSPARQTQPWPAERRRAASAGVASRSQRGQCSSSRHPPSSVSRRHRPS